MSQTTHAHPQVTTPEPCAQFPELVRMNYFHGQLLGPREFLTEQAYHRAKQQLINRCLHGYGVVCGLLVEPVPIEEACPDPDADRASAIDDEIDRVEAAIAEFEAAGTLERVRELEVRLEQLRREREALGASHRVKAPHRAIAHKLKLGCGFAIDPSGHEIVVGQGTTIDLAAYVSDSDRQWLTKEGRARLYVSVCYAECGIEPVRPAAMDSCQITPGCQDARIREAYRVMVSRTPPDADARCEFCCNGACGTCVLLAAVDVRAGRAIVAADVDNGVRRPFGLYAPTVITGINWHHGGTYSPHDAEALLGTNSNTGGLEIRFSRPIHVSTIKPGVVELLTYAGGRGVAGPITHITGAFVGLPASGMVDRIRYRDTTDERPRPGDRIMVIVRCDFLLDACCRPVDGNHVGGRVPYVGPLPAKHAAEPAPPSGNGAAVCAHPPGRLAAWTSGNGAAGGNFESWFFIERAKEAGA